MAMPVVLTGTRRAVASDVGSGSCRWLRLSKGNAETNKKDAAKAASFLFSNSSSVTQCSFPPSPGNCRRWDGGGWQDRWRHGWRHRAPMGEGALLAKHCFASARTHSRQRLGRTPEGVYGVSCQPPPSRPTISNPEPLWLWLLPAAGGPPRVSAAPPHPARSGSSRRCHQYRSSRSGSSPGTAGGSPRRSSTPVPDTRSRW